MTFNDKIKNMKRVLVISKQPIFSEYLRQKLSDEQIEVVIAQIERDAYTRMLSLLPNLVLVDLEEDNMQEMDFLEKKSEDPNAASIPVIIAGPPIEKTYLATFARYGVIKYFTKPIQFNLYFESIGKVLNIPLSMDDTPCVLDIHKNGSIVFIEIAEGLNREKISLLKYKLTELMERENIENPKIILMLTNLSLSFVDGLNLEMLFDNIIELDKVHTKYMKVLSFSPYVKDFIEGHIKYRGIEVAQNLPNVMNKLLDSHSSQNMSDIITDKILTSNGLYKDSEEVDIRFSTNSKISSDSDNGAVLNIAIIDSMIPFLEQTKTVFSSIGANCTTYSSGQQFIDDYKDDKFNLIILDIALADQSGFRILQFLRSEPKSPPVVIYTQAMQPEIIKKILGLGIKNFILKPQKPQVLIQKTWALLKNSF